MAIIHNNWYLVYTKPKQECRASQNLINQGLKVFLPQLFITGRDKHKKNTIVEPMFPRYLFVWLNLEQDNWHSIRSTKGVSHLVTFGDHPAIIKGFANIANILSEDKLVSTESENVSQGTDYEAEISKIVNDRDGPYWNKAHPDHDKVVQQVFTLRTMMNG